MNRLFTILLILGLMGLFMGLGIFLSDALFIITFICLLAVIVNLIWNLFPLKARRLFRDSRGRFTRIIMICLIFFLFFGEAINFFCFSGISQTMRLTGNIGIFIFTIIIGWSLMRKGRNKILIIGTTIFVIFIASLTITNLASHPHGFSHSTDKLKSLPYLSWVPAEKSIKKSGVILNQHKPSYRALNAYTDDGFPDAYLIDMDGNVLHTWSDGHNAWNHIKLLEDGDLLAIVSGFSLSRLDWDSNVKWEKKIPAHHDIDIAENGDIYTLTNNDDIVFLSGLPLPIKNDYIVVFSENGKLKKKYSLFHIIREKVPHDIFQQICCWWWRKYFPWRNLTTTIRKNMGKLIGQKGSNYNYYDIFHTNTIKLIDRDVEGLCKKGDLLICVRQLDLLGIIDIEEGKLIWSWGSGVLDGPHNSTLLENGNILVFDNGRSRTYSRIIEVNPRTSEIVWDYKSEPRHQFHSTLRGSCQRLPNGNTLITESEKGHVFEVTPEGKVVWEFYNPWINRESKQRRAIYRMDRITNPDKHSFSLKLKNIFNDHPGKSG